jgi:pimeloyl-ACP methyl ester carboxylesterase
VPVLIGHGSETMAHQAAGCRALAAEFGFGLYESPGVAHTAHVRHPDAFTQFIRHAMARPQSQT